MPRLSRYSWSRAIELDVRTRASAATSLLDRPLSAWWCVAGWVGSSAVFVMIVQSLGGPTVADAEVPNVSTWPIAHGQLSCAFPKNRIVTAPLYPFVSGALSAVARIGHGVPFPPRSALGPDCVDAYSAFVGWAVRADALHATLLVGYVAWLALVAGTVSLLRASGRGRCGWEPATLLLLASLPPVWMCMQNFFHPHDLMAMGLTLGAVAAVRRNSWVTAGVLVALAMLTQQFAILVAAPLFVVAPHGRKWVYAASACATLAVALVTLLVVSSSTAVDAAFLGSSNSAVSSTVLSSLHLHGGLRLYAARVVPVLLAMALAWWSDERLGPNVLEPVPLLSIVALSLSLRLVFEVNMWGYYYMALAVALVLVDVLSGRIRSTVVAWLVAVSIVYLVGPHTASDVWMDVSWGAQAQHFLVPVAAALAGALAVTYLARRSLAHGLVWLAVMVTALLAWPVARNGIGNHVTGPWWQAVLVAFGIALAGRPLLAQTRAAKMREDAPSSTSVALP